MPFLILLRPGLLRNFGGFLRDATRDSDVLALGSETHRHRVHYVSLEADQSLEQHKDAKSIMFELATVRDWIAVGQKLAEWDRTNACCIANKRLMLSGLDGAIEALMAGQGAMRQSDPLDIARISDEVVDEAIDCFKMDTSHHGLAALIVRMLASQSRDLRCKTWAGSMSDEAWELVVEKFYTALWILDLAGIEDRNSALLFGERHSLLYISPEAVRDIFQWFETAIKSDPGNSAVLEHMGQMLLPRWFGDYNRLETVARQAVVWTDREMGTAAYAILYNAAMQVDPAPLRFVDIDLFSEAVHDLVKYRRYSPVHLPALSQRLFALSRRPYPNGMNDKADRADWAAKREALHRLSLKILEDYLPAIHPDSWIGGEHGALEMISRAMGQELDDGLSLIVGPRGISSHQPITQSAA